MATSSSSSAATTDARPSSSTPLDSTPIPHQLTFLMSNIKGIISLTLIADNYPIWRSQVFKLFRANGFEGFLDSSCTFPSPHTPSSSTTLSYQTWTLLDQNLAVALYSVISPSILPYILSLYHCTEIWDTIARRLQSSTRSRTIQLRNELHHLSMKTKPCPNIFLPLNLRLTLSLQPVLPLIPKTSFFIP
ncbi:hypothetical protein M5K25_011263 [Dendrobium thyrsiflorum]|uniref:Retrotransposon Copia-like N-terminal domain-containing protein n=1 Tax=Dendrobium thyrsiflorum TaxID=117978 RepID=A0ABD0V2A9_DENTH